MSPPKIRRPNGTATRTAVAQKPPKKSHGCAYHSSMRAHCHAVVGAVFCVFGVSVVSCSASDSNAPAARDARPAGAPVTPNAPSTRVTPAKAVSADDFEVAVLEPPALAAL